MQLINSIAFYPFLIAFSLLALAWLTAYLDNIKVGGALLSKASFLSIDNANTARSLLSSLLSGLISLVTFTFAMVMIVLTQVTSSFSPRLLPNLLSKRGSQVVLGTIVGTICFTMVVLSNVQTMSGGPEVPRLSMMINLFLGFACVLSFIYFIHKISNEIQIGNILNSQYRATRDSLDRELNSGNYHEDWEEQEGQYLVKAWDSGYFDTITEPQFKNGSSKLGLTTTLLKNQGMYLLKGEPFLKMNKPMNKEIQELVEENILFRHQEMVEENFVYGFKLLTEVAVKALSPGINDPGTAMQAIDYLLDLLCRLQALRGRKVIKKDGVARLVYQPVPFETIFRICTASIRAYSSTDVAVQARLIDLISKVSARDERKKHTALFAKELKSIEEASSKEMKSQEDIDFIKALVQNARQEYKL
ncbi:DUF2254 domain-containing protein [Pontibacter akesuensis]|uniref:Uncharacterized membrane protein n=2 Tax=Pontibacter akesuensis TaxID=388950 RepID=A0A1I7KTE8_9BACT|nr:DUF2254 domain-containing protein [Pontibacter akesuensis]SFV00677.1 Uncharacterized membrane protein [Pontibacter akesuensis]